jgi:hypothetical protein
MTAPDPIEMSDEKQVETNMSEPQTVGEIVDQLPSPVGRPALTPMGMLQAALDRGMSADMIGKLMDLQERWEATEARKAYDAAMLAFKRTAPELIKNKHVVAGKMEFDHLTLDEACNVIIPALNKHDLFHTWSSEQRDGLVYVTCTLTHAQGHRTSVTLNSGADASGGKNGIQAIGSAATYLARYTLLMATGLAARDQDNDGRDANTISAEQKEELISLMKETDTDTKKYLEYLGVRALDEILVIGFTNAKDALLRKRKKVAPAKSEA